MMCAIYASIVVLTSLFALLAMQTVERIPVPDPRWGRKATLVQGALIAGGVRIPLAKAEMNVSYRRAAWFAPDDLLLNLDDRFYRVSLSKKKVLLAGTSYG